MTKQLLVIAALSATLGISVSFANAAPAASMLEMLKPRSSEGSTVEQVRYYRRGHRHYRHHNCWWGWGDRWMCRYFW